MISLKYPVWGGGAMLILIYLKYFYYFKIYFQAFYALTIALLTKMRL